MTRTDLLNQATVLMKEPYFDPSDIIKIAYHAFRVIVNDLKQERFTQARDRHLAEYHKFIDIANFNLEMEREL